MHGPGPPLTSPYADYCRRPQNETTTKSCTGCGTANMLLPYLDDYVLYHAVVLSPRAYVYADCGLQFTQDVHLSLTAPDQSSM